MPTLWERWGSRLWNSDPEGFHLDTHQCCDPAWNQAALLPDHLTAVIITPPSIQQLHPTIRTPFLIPTHSLEVAQQGQQSQQRQPPCEGQAEMAFKMAASKEPRKSRSPARGREARDREGKLPNPPNRLSHLPLRNSLPPD